MKKIIGRFSLTATLTCLLLAGCSKSSDDSSLVKKTEGAPQGPTELKVKWIVGKQYHEQMTMDQDMEFTVPGNSQPMQQQMEVTQEFSLSVLKARPEGGAEVEMKFVSQKMSSKMGGRELMSFDSTADPSNDGANPMAPTLRKITGAHVKFLMDAEGKVEKVDDYDEFMKHISAGASPQSEMMISGMFSEDTLKQFASHSQGLPEKPVNVGDTWPSHLEISAGPMGTMKMDMKYKLAGWEQHDGHNCALLTFTGDVTSKVGTNKSAMSMTIEKGVISGKNWFDPALGTTMESDADQSMSMKISMQGQKSDSKMKQKILTKLTGMSDLPK